MKRGRFTEEQIIATPREQEAGSKTADVCRKHGVCSAAFYKWKATYGGILSADQQSAVGRVKEQIVAAAPCAAEPSRPAHR